MKCPKCGTEIMKHQEGLCLDEWVRIAWYKLPLPSEAEMLAEAQLAWKTQPQCIAFQSLGGFFAHKDEGEWVFRPAVPRFSTDGIAALSLLQNMWKTNDVHLRKDGVFIPSGKHGGCKFLMAENESIPLQICRAAILLSSARSAL